MENEQPGDKGINALKPGDHLCYLYENDDQRPTVLTRFLRQGLDQNEKVLYITDARGAETVLEYLRADGVDVEPALGRGQLNILTTQEAYLRGGTFDPGEMIDLLRSETEQALSQGYGAIRVTGEMTWAMQDLPGSDRLVEYEARLNDFFSGSRCVALCQYDMRRFAPALLLDVLRTHPLAVIGAETYDNPHYIPPSNLLGMDRAASDLRHWMQDMVNRKEADAALRESEAYFREITENASDMIVIVDEKGSITYASPSVERFLGYRPEEMIGKSTLDFIHPEDIQRAMLDFGAAVSTEETAIPNSFRVFHKDGSARVLEGLGKNLLHHPTVSGFIMNVHDITESRRLQGQLQETRKMEAIATLAGGIAHQFNNALSSIIGNIDLLEMDQRKDDTMMESLKDMKASGRRMAHLTSQLLAYARGGKYNIQTISLSRFVTDTMPLIEHTLNPDVRVETDLPPDVFAVKADLNQMQMVLSALMTNANEATEGPGRIRVSTKNMELDQGSIKDHPGLKPGPYVCLSIEDNGKGMDKETRERIFEPFFTTHFIGRGLGMPAAYGIVTNHDGGISVDSEPGKGTTVSIYLPALETREEVEEGLKERIVSAPLIDLPTGEGTVLVIEDEEPLVRLFRKILEMLGYRVLEARTGEEAVEMAKTFDSRIDLALLDIKLPDMTGNQVYPLIMEARPNLKVVVCSGYSIDGPAQEILDAGAQAFIQKPFFISTLAEKLKEVLGGK
jgi:two-component system cell cycle sensor histidine kinase/response regulator CckA